MIHACNLLNLHIWWNEKTGVNALHIMCFYRYILLFFLFTLFICHTSIIQAQSRRLDWEFPLPRAHTGILLGNGVQGLMVWGMDNELKITVGRAGFWDRRGGNDFSSRVNYQEVKSLLESNDEAGLKKAFSVENSRYPDMRPHQIGGGRLSITFPEAWNLTRGSLDINKAIITVRLKHENGNEAEVKIRQAVNEELAIIHLPEISSTYNLQPSWNFVKDQLKEMKVKPPVLKVFEDSGYFEQQLPEDAPLGMAFEVKDNELLLATHVGLEAGDTAREKLKQKNTAAILDVTEQWWQHYWNDVPSVNLPDPILQELYDYGLYKQACSTPPQGLPCTLQGPFLESYRLPPWSADYHFNINIEMIYWPVLATNRTQHLAPLWEMIKGWLPDMRKTGEAFFQSEGAIMMPHAVDDKCQVVGTFWTGTIDHACAAWMAELAWQHYKYDLDTTVLEEIAWPLLEGTFEGYWAMKEISRDANGQIKYTLPVSVSPEFRGASMNAWGRDASFQLAAFHMVSENLIEAAKILGKAQDRRWEQVSKHLPPYTTVEEKPTNEWPGNKIGKRIALWVGMDLPYSHRHHSHLASIYPFVTINPMVDLHREVISNSIQHLTYLGPGGWSGWCVPWTSTLHARLNQSDAAVTWLHLFEEVFTNEGRGTLHNAAYPGISLIADYPWAKRNDEVNQEIMQLDGGFGAITAILELLVQHRRDGIYILPDIPMEWKDLSFNNIRTEGAFQLSAELNEGSIKKVEIKSLKGGKIKLHHGLGNTWYANDKLMYGEVLDRQFTAGEKMILTATPLKK